MSGERLAVLVFAGNERQFPAMVIIQKLVFTF